MQSDFLLRRGMQGRSSNSLRPSGVWERALAVPHGLRRFLLVPLAAALVLPAVSLRAQELQEVKGFFPVTIAGATVRLEGMLIRRADAQGRLPVAIFTNGGLTPTSNATSISADDYARYAREMARRGWLTVVALRRGYGKSEGAKPVPMQCQAAAFKSWAQEAADDLQAVMSMIAQRPDADPARVVVIGSESGGAAAVALSARNPRGLVAAVSIGGGVAAESGCSMADILAQAFREYGAANRVPNLWVYAKADKVIDRKLADRMHAGFLDGGGDVKFIEFWSWGNTDKEVFRSSWQQWMLQLDAFLRARKLPTWTDANTQEVLDKLGLKGGRRQTIFKTINEGYVSLGGEKVMGWSPATQTPWQGRWDTLETARTRMLEYCRKIAPDCIIVMENMQWVGPKL